MTLFEEEEGTSKGEASGVKNCTSALALFLFNSSFPQAKKCGLVMEKLQDLTALLFASFSEQGLVSYKYASWTLDLKPVSKLTEKSLSNNSLGLLKTNNLTNSKPEKDAQRTD